MEVLAVPEIAFVLLAVGLLGVLTWAAHPARIATGLTGTVLLLSGTTGMWLLPVSPGAGLLLGFAAACLLLEVLAYPGFGLHATGGFVSLTFAGLFLHEPWSGAHPALVVPISAAAAGLVCVTARRSWRRTRADPFAVSDVVTGRETVILGADGSLGLAVVCGHVCQIRARRGPLHSGQIVRVAGTARDLLLVEPADAPGTRRHGRE